jgi:EF hand domain-containing protein
MRPATFPALVAATVLALLLTPGPNPGQPPPPPSGNAGPGGHIPKPPPDEFRSLIREVEEAYKAPHEVDKDILDELRKQYRNPTPERETKIFREIRRLYQTTPEQDQAIVRELRRAYENPSAEQEERVFQAIRRNGKLPLGTVPVSIQAEQAMKLFTRFDQNGDGVLNPDEMPDGIRGQWQQWDRNRDKSINFEEYRAYYRAHLDWVSEKVATGEIALKLPKSMTGLEPGPGSGQGPRPQIPQTQPTTSPVRHGKPSGLPSWFQELDADGDGQIALHEWRRAGRPISEFEAMDLDGDNLLPASEYLRYLRQSGLAETPEPAAKPGSNGSPPGRGKQ